MNEIPIYYLIFKSLLDLDFFYVVDILAKAPFLHCLSEYYALSALEKQGFSGGK